MISFLGFIQIYRITKEWFPHPIIAILLCIIGTTIIVKNRKKIIGYAIITGNYLHYLAVSSRYHGKGYGKKLFEKILPSIKKLRVNVKNKKAISLYESHGFKIIGTSNWITGKKYIMMLE